MTSCRLHLDAPGYSFPITPFEGVKRQPAIDTVSVIVDNHSVLTDIESAAVDGSDELAQIVAANLRALRKRRGLSLERLANVCGVSRAMLSQIELGRSMPTIKVVWKIAKAFDIPFSALITDSATSGLAITRASECKTVTTQCNTTTVRALFPAKSPRRFEFYEWSMAPRTSETAQVYGVGSTENLAVKRGSLELSLGNERAVLAEGDTVLLHAAAPHGYRVLGAAPALFFVLVVFAEPIL